VTAQRAVPAKSPAEPALGYTPYSAQNDFPVKKTLQQILKPLFQGGAVCSFTICVLSLRSESRLQAARCWKLVD
jgi:hypothetical protein